MLKYILDPRRLKYRPAYPYWFVLIFAPPGNGKSLDQAYSSYLTFLEYYFIEKFYPELPHRILQTNQELKLDFLLSHKKGKLFTKEFLTSHYQFWQDEDELRYCPRLNCWKGTNQHNNHDVDISIDEGANIFPSDAWKDRPRWIREQWMQHRHRGIRILMLTQDYMMIDINARRMLWRAYYMQKSSGSRDISATLPKLSKWTWKNFLSRKKEVIWGRYKKIEFDPLVMKLDTLALLTLQTNPLQAQTYYSINLIGKSTSRLITWFKINLYDTQQELAKKNENGIT